MAKGLRDDRAAHGDDARRSSRPTRRSSRACLRGALRRVADETFNAITVDGECSTNDCVFLLASGQSGVASRATTTRRFSRRCERSPAISRARSCEAARARPSSSPCTSPARVARRCVAGGADDRELAAREDRDSWRRSELGPARRRRRPIRRGVRARARVGGRSAPCRSSWTACRTTSAPISRDGAASAGGHGRGGPRHGRRARRHDVDVRFQRGIRAHQRGVPDMSQKCRASYRSASQRRKRCLPSLRTKDFLSVLDLRPGELDRVLDLAAPMKRTAPTRQAGPQPLAGQHVALLFEKPSLRTRSTFVIAVRELGGEVIEPPAEVAFGGRETVEDVARNLERWVLAPSSARSRRSGWRASPPPRPRLHVVNALTDEEHPCQALADMLTLQERLGSVARPHADVRRRRQQRRGIARARRRDARPARARGVASWLRAAGVRRRCARSGRSSSARRSR